MKEEVERKENREWGLKEERERKRECESETKPFLTGSVWLGFNIINSH